MLNTALRDPQSIGEILARKLKPAQRWRPRPRAKRPTRTDELKAALHAIPGMQPVLDALVRVREVQLAEGLAEYRLGLSEDRLRRLREDQQEAYESHRRATTAAEKFRHYEETECLGVRILEAEARLRRSRALLGNVKRQHEQAAACVQMALRGLVR